MEDIVSKIKKIFDKKNKYLFVKDGTISQKLYHQQFNTPPEGSYTGLNKVETVEPVKDQSNDMEQIQHRIVILEDEWKLIKKFYENYSYVVSVQTTSEMDRVYLSDEVQNQINEYNLMRERKLKMEIEAKLALENLLKQKFLEEEEVKIAKKKAEMEAAAAEAQKVKKSV